MGRANKSVVYVRAAATIAALCVMSVGGWAVAQSTTTPADAVRVRHDNFHQLGGAFKGVNDQLHASTPDLASIRANAQILANLAQQLPTWFPAGSGPESGEHTGAKAEIWTHNADFLVKAHGLQTETAQLVTVAAGTDVAAIGAEAHAVGERCGACHSVYRQAHH